MYELWYYFFLEDGKLHPDHPPEMAHVCYPEEIPDHVRDVTRLTEEEYYCPQVYFEKKWECELAAPALLGAAQFDGFYNGAESRPIYGVFWQCRKSDGKIS